VTSAIVPYIRVSYYQKGQFVSSKELSLANVSKILFKNCRDVKQYLEECSIVFNFKKYIYLLRSFKPDRDMQIDYSASEYLSWIHGRSTYKQIHDARIAMDKSFA